MSKLPLLLMFLFTFSFTLGATEPPVPNPPQSGDFAHGAEKVGAEMARPGEDHGEHHEQPKFLGMPAWIFKLINMILFISVLVYLLKGPIGGAFRDRRAAIQSQLQEANERRAKADRLAHDIQARLDQIEGEVASILQRAREEGDRQKAELIAAAEAESQKILAQARTEVDMNLKSARQDLSAYARQLATQRAEQIVRESMTDADRKRLFEESIQKVAEVRA